MTLDFRLLTGLEAHFVRKQSRLGSAAHHFPPPKVQLFLQRLLSGRDLEQKPDGKVGRICAHQWMLDSNFWAEAIFGSTQAQNT